MNLFRSEEHVRNWSGFKIGTEGGIIPLQNMITIFSGKFFARRLDPDYMTHFKDYIGEFVGVLKEIGQSLPFWSPE